MFAMTPQPLFTIVDYIVFGEVGTRMGICRAAECFECTSGATNGVNDGEFGTGVPSGTRFGGVFAGVTRVPELVMAMEGPRSRKISAGKEVKEGDAVRQTMASATPGDDGTTGWPTGDTTGRPTAATGDAAPA